MESRIIDILNNNEDNYVMPFYCCGKNNNISADIQKIHQFGCRAICVNSNSNSGFSEKWFKDLAVVLKECKYRNIKVWILDDNNHHSGYANGVANIERAFKKKYVLERHFDVIGPKNSVTAFIKKFEDDDEILGAYLFKRTVGDEKVFDEYIDLSDNIYQDRINFDVPEGVYILFVYFKSHYRADDYIDMLNPKATDMMIKNCYQPHFDKFGEYFGETFAGFFSDKPGFYTDYYDDTVSKSNYFSRSVGSAGLCIPISDDALRLMSKKAEYDVKPYLFALWYDIGDKTGEIRHNYMNTISKLYSRYFTQKLGRWCKAHGVEYIGNNVCDNNSHSKLGCSAVHYFRSQHGQSMSGMDLSYQQIIPGFAHYTTSSFGVGAKTDNEFYHYLFAKMCASDAHFDETKNNNAFCEVFSNDGFAQSSGDKKWLIDFLLVRGINHFALHTLFGDECFANYDAVCTLMKYVNKASHLLSGGKHIAKALVLYNADCEWGSCDDFMYSQKICKRLYDAHIDFDIISFDYLKKAEALNNRLTLNGEEYDIIFVPYSRFIYSKNLNVLKNLNNVGFEVVFVGGLPKNCSYKFNSVPLNECVKYFDKNCEIDVIIRGKAELLRHYHIKRDTADVYMFFNESVTDEVDARIYVGKKQYIKLDLINNSKIKGETRSGQFDLKLSPYQSVIYVFDDFDNEFLEQFKPEKSWDFERILNIPFDVEISENVPNNEFEHYCVTDRPFNINSPDHKPEFAGKIKYSGKFFIEENGNFYFDLGMVGENARVFVNGNDCGIRIAKPFVFDASGFTNEGENQIEIIVCNNLAYKLKDDVLKNTILPASGLSQEIKMYRQI